MRKVNFKNSRGLNLIGEFYSADSESVVIMSHGFTGDKSEWGMFDRVAEELNKYGFNIFKYDFSGSGESDDDSLSVEKQVDDLQSAIEYVEDKRMKKIGLYGHSLGGLVSLKNYSSKVKAMVLTAPVTDKKDVYVEERFSEEQLKELKEKGYITNIRDKGVRKRIIIDKKYLEERETINQDELLKPIKCPVIIIHGDEDDSVPIEWSKSAIEKLPKSSKLEILSGEDHDFENSLNKIAYLSGDWFKKYLK